MAIAVRHACVSVNTVHNWPDFYIVDPTPYPG